jgi:hypothetical protein
MRRYWTELACMVRRRSTVRFLNGAPLAIRPGQKLTGQLSSYAADGSCCRIGRNLGDRVLPGRQSRPGRPPRGSAGRQCRAPRRETRRPAAPSHRGCAFNRGVARWPYGHEMITLPEHSGEPWQCKAGVKSSITADRPDRHGLAVKVRSALTAAPRSRRSARIRARGEQGVR